jgi:hypothetical protein
LPLKSASVMLIDKVADPSMKHAASKLALALSWLMGRPAVTIALVIMAASVPGVILEDIRKCSCSCSMLVPWGSSHFSMASSSNPSSLSPNVMDAKDPLAYKGRVDLISHQAILRGCLYLHERSDHDGIQVIEALPGEVKFCCRFDLLDWQLILVHLQLGQRPAVQTKCEKH